MDNAQSLPDGSFNPIEQDLMDAVAELERYNASGQAGPLRLAGLHLKIADLLLGGYVLDVALEHARAALDHAQAAQDPPLTAQALETMGVAAFLLDDYAPAFQHLTQALELYRTLGDRPAQARALLGLGNVHQFWDPHDTGPDLPAAQAAYAQALHISLELGGTVQPGNLYYQLGRVAHQQGDLAQAQGYYEQAAAAYAAGQDHFSQALIYGSLAEIAEAHANWPLAEAHYQQALQAYAAGQDAYNQAHIYMSLGTAARQQGDPARARGYYEQALEMYRQFQDERSVQAAQEALKEI